MLLSFNLCEFFVTFKFLSLLGFTHFYPLKAAVQSVESSYFFQNFLSENDFTSFLISSSSLLHVCSCDKIRFLKKGDELVIITSNN